MTGTRSGRAAAARRRNRRSRPGAAELVADEGRRAHGAGRRGARGVGGEAVVQGRRRVELQQLLAHAVGSRRPHDRSTCGSFTERTPIVLGGVQLLRPRVEGVFGHDCDESSRRGRHPVAHVDSQRDDAERRRVGCQPAPRVLFAMWLVERKVCSRRDDFQFDPVSASICCPSPHHPSRGEDTSYCCPNSVRTCDRSV